VSNTSKPPPYLERVGVRFMESVKPPSTTEASDAVYVLNPQERAALRSIERAVIARAFLIGALAAIICAVPPIVFHTMKSENPKKYWAIYIGANVISALAEVMVLFWDGLRSVRALAHTAGLDLTSRDMTSKTAVASALARAALEMPNPPDAVEGINPWREASKFTLMVAPLLYKLKITLTNLALKFLVRRALGRAATRAVLELIAVPVNALWDAWVCWTIVHEARLRVMGPSAAEEFVRLIFPENISVAHDTARVAVRGIASAIVRTQDMHPNLVALLGAARVRLGVQEVIEMDNPKMFLQEIRTLDESAQTSVLRMLAVASIIDGKLARDERRLLLEAFEACGRQFNLVPIEALRKAFTSGNVIPREAMDAVAT
jgi:hypothetical protein